MNGEDKTYKHAKPPLPGFTHTVHLPCGVDVQEEWFLDENNMTLGLKYKVMTRHGKVFNVGYGILDVLAIETEEED